MALLLMALLRIKRPEELKERAPVDLGRVLGLDRAPEVKTLRRKLSRLAFAGQAEAFGRKLAERRVASRGPTLERAGAHVRSSCNRRFDIRSPIRLHRPTSSRIGLVPSCLVCWDRSFVDARESRGGRPCLGTS